MHPDPGQRDSVRLLKSFISLHAWVKNSFFRRTVIYMCSSCLITESLWGSFSCSPNVPFCFSFSCRVCCSVSDLRLGFLRQLMLVHPDLKASVETICGSHQRLRNLFSPSIPLFIKATVFNTLMLLFVLWLFSPRIACLAFVTLKIKNSLCLNANPGSLLE